MAMSPISTTKKKAKLRKECDKLWHLAVIKKYGNDCFFRNDYKRSENCKETATTCHHFKPKGQYGHLRYEILNGVPICWPCHTKAEQTDNSLLPEIPIKRGRKWYNKIEEMAKNRPNSSFQTLTYYKKVKEKLLKILET